MPRVLNKRTDKIPSDAVYVGRPSKWGNPMTVQEVKRLFPHISSPIEINRRAVAWYKEYLAEDARMHNNSIIKQAQQELRGKDLVC